MELKSWHLVLFPLTNEVHHAGCCKYTTQGYYVDSVALGVHALHEQNMCVCVCVFIGTIQTVILIDGWPLFVYLIITGTLRSSV
jgi:hypothetical protein